MSTRKYELNSFMIVDINGVDKVSYTYNELDSSGNQISCNNKKNFNVENDSLKNYIDKIKEYIIENQFKKDGDV